MNLRLWNFIGGASGRFRVTRQVVICGEPLPLAPFLAVVNGAAPIGAVPSGLEPSFHLRGVVSNERYVTAQEKQALKAEQQALGRPSSSLGALIPIRKTQAWWELSQGERRAIVEERSGHIALGMRALPQVARRLHHCRDLTEAEPFDFITWFDFKDSDVQRFDDLLGALRATEEWRYVDREVDLRVERVDAE